MSNIISCFSGKAVLSTDMWEDHPSTASARATPSVSFADSSLVNEGAKGRRDQSLLCGLREVPTKSAEEVYTRQSARVTQGGTIAIVPCSPADKQNQPKEAAHIWTTSSRLVCLHSGTHTHTFTGSDCLCFVRTHHTVGKSCNVRKVFHRDMFVCGVDICHADADVDNINPVFEDPGCV